MIAPARPPTPADEPILRALARFHYLTAEQIRRLLYGRGVITYARKRLKALVDAKYVERLEQPHPSRTGSAANVFRLATKGYNFLEELGVPVVRLPGERPASYLYYRHTLALNDTLIAAELLTRTFPQLRINRLVHERELKHTSVKVELSSGKTVGVIPDAYLQLHEAEAIGPGFWYDLVVELDMGTTDQREWRQKVEALLVYGVGPYRQALGAASITIAVLTPLGDRRATELLSWTEDELARLGRQEYGAWFCVCGVDAAQVSPEELFLAPIWRQPFQAEAIALIGLGEEAV